MKFPTAAVVAVVLASAGMTSSILAGPSGASASNDASSPAPSPDFDCSRVKSRVLQLICTTPELARLDAQLGNIFRNSSGQAGIDAKALRQSEDVWLATVRNPCGDVACLENAYTHRIEALKDQSLQAASPAAYAETRPFAVDPSTLSHVRGFIGQPCAVLTKPSADMWSGFSPIKGFMPVITSGATVRPVMRDQSRFAFLTTDTADGG
jgi:uncharacterized protein